MKRKLKPFLADSATTSAGPYFPFFLHPTTLPAPVFQRRTPRMRVLWRAIPHSIALFASTRTGGELPALYNTLKQTSHESQPCPLYITKECTNSCVGRRTAQTSRGPGVQRQQGRSGAIRKATRWRGFTSSSTARPRAASSPPPPSPLPLPYTRVVCDIACESGNDEYRGS